MHPNKNYQRRVESEQATFVLKKFIVATIAFTLLLLVFTGCRKRKSVSQTHLVTVAAGHEISADIDGVASFDNQNAQAVIVSQFGQIVIERSRVLFGSNAWTDIPDGAPITLNFSQDKYSVQWTTNK